LTHPFIHPSIHPSTHPSIRVNKVPQPFTSVTAPHEVEYLNDVRAYDLDNTSWHGLRAGSSGGDDERVDAAPPGRYGEYIAAADR